MAPVKLISFSRRKAQPDIGCSRQLPALLAPPPGVTPHGIVTDRRSRARAVLRTSGSTSAVHERIWPHSPPAIRRAPLPIVQASAAAGQHARTRKRSLSTSAPRTVFRDTFRSRAISLIVLPLMKCSRRIRAIVSTTSTLPPASFESRQRRQGHCSTGLTWLRRDSCHDETHARAAKELEPQRDIVHFDAAMNYTLMKSRHLANEVVSLPQAVEIAQGVERQRTIGCIMDRMFINDRHCTPIHARERNPKGSPGGRRVEHPRSREGLAGLYAGQPLAESL